MVGRGSCPSHREHFYLFFLVRAPGHGLFSTHQWREQGAAGRALAGAQFGFHPLSTGGRGCDGLTGMVQELLIFKAFETAWFEGKIWCN